MATSIVVPSSQFFHKYPSHNLEREPKHPALRLIDYLTLNFVIEMLAWSGDAEKVIKVYEMLGIVSALIAGISSQQVLVLPASLPTSASNATFSTSSTLGSWLVVSAMGSAGISLLNILCCAMVIVALHACPDHNQMIYDIPLAGLPLVLLILTILFLLSYLAAFLYVFLPEFAVPIIVWFSICTAIFFGVTFYIFGIYLPPRIMVKKESSRKLIVVKEE